MADSPNLTLERLVAGQSSAEVTHNEAINKLDSLVHLSILDRDLTAPPGGESEGDRYLVGTSATGAWAGQDDDLAFYYSGWVFVTPIEGMLLWIADEDVLVLYDGTNWVGPTFETLTLTGALSRSTTAGITASVTQTQGQGPLTTDINEVSTVANPSDTVTLPVATAGKIIRIINNGANILQVFPASGDQIDGGGVDTAMTMPAGAMRIYIAKDGTDWYTLGAMIDIDGGTIDGAVIGASSAAAGTFTDLTATGKLIDSAQVGITAGTTQTQGQVPLTKDINEVSVCANANDVVTLPAAEAGRVVRVINNGANVLQVFPASGDDIDGIGVDSSVTVAVGDTGTFIGIDGTNWQRPAVPAAGAMTEAFITLFRTASFDMPATNTWYDYPFDRAASSPKKNVTHDHTTNPEQITLAEGGTYAFSYYAMKKIGANSMNVRVLDDGTEIPGSFGQCGAATGDTQAAVQSFIAFVVANSVIELQVGTDVAGNDVFYNDTASLPDATTFVSASLTITKISDDVA